MIWCYRAGSELSFPTSWSVIYVTRKMIFVKNRHFGEKSPVTRNLSWGSGACNEYILCFKTCNPLGLLPKSNFPTEKNSRNEDMGTYPFHLASVCRTQLQRHFGRPSRFGGHVYEFLCIIPVFYRFRTTPDSNFKFVVSLKPRVNNPQKSSILTPFLPHHAPIAKK